MRYADIADTKVNRFRLPSSHPILAEITLDPADWQRFQQLYTDDPTIHIVSHQAPQGRRMVVYVGCVSYTVRDCLENALLGLMDVRR